MKKRLFNSKRKLLSLIALGVLLAFVISSGILAFITYDEIRLDFDKYTSRMLDNIDGYYMDYSNPEECHSPEHFLDIISGHQLYRYPTAIALYDRNGKLLAYNELAFSVTLTSPNCVISIVPFTFWTVISLPAASFSSTST